jgi:hypothetical protein
VQLNDHAATLENAHDVVAIANAVMAAKQHDTRRAAAGLLIIASLLVDDDVVGRLVLATLMREAADELDVSCVFH